MATLGKAPDTPQRLFSSRRGRILRENLTAYLFLLPAIVLIFTFGIFPVAFAFFVSLHQWRRFPGEYRALGNFTRAIGDFSYVLFFWLALATLVYAAYRLYQMWRDTDDERGALFFLVPGIANAIALVLFTNWFFTTLVIILNIPNRIRGQEITRSLFMNELWNSFQFPEALDAFWPMLAAIIVAIGISITTLRILTTSRNTIYLMRGSLVAIFVAFGIYLLQLTLNEIDTAITVARDAGEDLPLWSQIIMISLGAALVGGAYWVWQRAVKADSDRRFIMMSAAALLLVFGGYLLVMELPQAFASADDDLLNGFRITAMFAFGTVPIQLTIGLGLAYLLFQNIQGKALFRMIYFIPYITPFVATSVVFGILFSNRESSPINKLIGIFGIEPQTWLLEPKGIFLLIFGDGVPDILHGPGLALVVIMMYTIWTFVGYNAVVFLAGLGNIPSELYEAARIDGASGWRVFRHITLPLLSPTTFFLSLIAIIGTFKAFTQIFLMRRPASFSAVDTVSIYIFETVRTNSRLGYGSALAFVLFGVILLLTIFQNRIMGRRVFYG
ncbi:MAG: sugar ABC transporter permease [Chloroflexi bacterium]|nr:MAG: sugar ABC transporter permease [Chloroflexota bacterium]